MKNDEFSQMLAEVEDIIDQLARREVSIEKGNCLKQRGRKLLDELEALLGKGEGRTVVVQSEGDEIVEKELLF